jgi:hypothetical protein
MIVKKKDLGCEPTLNLYEGNILILVLIIMDKTVNSLISLHVGYCSGVPINYAVCKKELAGLVPMS